MRVGLGNKRLDGVASFGRRPTFDNGAPLLEVFLFDFKDDLYGRELDVAFIDFIRDELKFDSIEAQNTHLAYWEERWAAPRIHGRKKRQVLALFEEEKPHLKPLPLEGFRYFRQEKRTVDDNAIVNATVLSSDLTPHSFSQAVLAPQSRTSFSPRLDWQLGASHTFTARYTYSSVDRSQVGIGGFSLPARAYDTSQTQHTFQLSETSVLGKVVNETHFRFSRERAGKTGDDSVPTLQVLDAFTGGGAQVGPSFNRQDRWELQNVTSFTKGGHSVRAGFRLRGVREDDVARQGFGGTILFFLATRVHPIPAGFWRWIG